MLIISTKRFITIFSIIAMLLAIMITPCQSFADEISDAKEEIEAAEELLEAIPAQIDEANDQISNLQQQVDELASAAQINQEELVQLQDEQSQNIIALYKLGGTDGLIEMVCKSSTITDLMKTIEYISSVSSKLDKNIIECQKIKLDLDSQIAQIDTKKSEQAKIVEEATTKQEELSARITELKDKIDTLETERIKSIASRSSVYKAETFETGDTSGWASGVASAYGGWSDASVADNARTATGDAVTESSMGVAIPMAWNNFRSYFGRKVEISYNGKSVIATVNDCGGMGGGSRSLDLQPGVFKSFGANSCQEWGLRTVKYRFL